MESSRARVVIGTRARIQAPHPAVVCAALLDPHEYPYCEWLVLLDDEVEPTIVAADPPRRVVWTSIWLKRPDALIEFDLLPGAGGTVLRWTVTVDEPAPDDSAVGHIRYRMNWLINKSLRDRFGQ